MRLVIIESPLAGDVEAHVAYAKRCLADCLARGEAPFASHLLYPHVLDDTAPRQREQGISAGFAWGARAELVAVYTDYGISGGMTMGIKRAQEAGQPIEFRSLEPNGPDSGNASRGEK